MAKRSADIEEADDENLLREALAGVAPLARTDRVTHQKRKPAPIPTQHLADEAQVLTDSLSDEAPLDLSFESGNELVYLRNGLATQILRKLRRGFWAVQDHIDLHGLRSDAARELLVDFLNHALSAGYRCVRVVHGKGHRSRNQEPVLKMKMARWLQQRDEVLAYCQAPPADGGSGATVILLKSKRVARQVPRS